MARRRPCILAAGWQDLHMMDTHPRRQQSKIAVNPLNSFPIGVVFLRRQFQIRRMTCVDVPIEIQHSSHVIPSW